MTKNKKTVTLINNETNEKFDFDILKATEGPDVIDITSLYKKTGMFTYDPGFNSTASCSSKISYIDGEKGILSHRGYKIEDLCEKNKYLDVCYLLMHGKLPTDNDAKIFSKRVKYHNTIHEQMHFFFRGFRRDSHPMSIMVGAIGALASFYNTSEDVFKIKEKREKTIIRIISKIPTLAAMAYKYSIGQPFVYPRNELSFSENFLNMMFKKQNETYKINPIIADVMDKIFILHADHEQNASTSTVRTAASSYANPYACISSGVASLWGPSHGGANQAVIEMLKKIGSKENIPAFIKEVKDKNSKTRLMGFGHRVYKNHDPRATILKKYCPLVLKELKIKDALLETAIELEKIALNDDYFVSRKLYPNVDFYSGIILKAIGFPPEMFTVLFAVGRSIGWAVQWDEMISGNGMKISRPRQLYNGNKVK